MKQKVNYLGFLSLLGLIGLMGWSTGNTVWYSFFGFAYFLRYFWVRPDEYFLAYVQKSSTMAFMAEMLSLVPLVYICTQMADAQRSMPMAFGLSFAVAILVFSISLAVMEWREQRGASDD